MRNCVACGKNLLFGENVGDASFCASCFGRVKGILWRCTYDKYEDAEKQRSYALDLAYKNGFSQEAMSVINEFFMSQVRNMKICACCGNTVQQLQQIGTAKICSACFKRINNSSWKKTDFEDNKEVETNRERVLDIARKYDYPPNVIQGINQHFDKKVQKGLLCVVKSDCGQIMKVFNNRVQIINTEGFDREEIAIEYGKLQYSARKSQPKKEDYSVRNFVKDAKKVSNVVKTVSKIARPGGIARATINVAMSLAEKAPKHNMEETYTTKGEFKSFGKSINIDYAVCDSIDYQRCGDNEIGFIRFIKASTRDYRKEDVVFFFDCDDKMLDEAYDMICERIEKIRQEKIEKEEYISQEKCQSALINNGENTSVADEILKFKNLLDIGAITQEEYETKKKELLKQ